MLLAFMCGDFLIFRCDSVEGKEVPQAPDGLAQANLIPKP